MMEAAQETHARVFVHSTMGYEKDTMSTLTSNSSEKISANVPLLAHCFDFTNYLLPSAVSVFPSLLSVPDKSTVHYVLSTTQVQYSDILPKGALCKNLPPVKFKTNRGKHINTETLALSL